MIYLDNSATTRPNEACVAAMNELLTECWFNPSSVYRPGMDAAHRLKTARAQIAQALGAEAEPRARSGPWTLAFRTART